MDVSKRRKEILEEMFVLMAELNSLPLEDTPEPKAPQYNEMLTIKQCTKEFPGISDHTVRILIKSGKVASIRTGTSIRGKYLVSKQSLCDYLTQNNS